MGPVAGGVVGSLLAVGVVVGAVLLHRRRRLQKHQASAAGPEEESVTKQASLEKPPSTSSLPAPIKHGHPDWGDGMRSSAVAASACDGRAVLTGTSGATSAGSGGPSVPHCNSGYSEQPDSAAAAAQQAIATPKGVPQLLGPFHDIAAATAAAQPSPGKQPGMARLHAQGDDLQVDGELEAGERGDADAPSSQPPNRMARGRWGSQGDVQSLRGAGGRLQSVCSMPLISGMLGAPAELGSSSVGLQASDASEQRPGSPRKFLGPTRSYAAPELHQMLSMQTSIGAPSDSETGFDVS